MQLDSQLQKSLHARYTAGDTIDMNSLSWISKTLIPTYAQSVLRNNDIEEF